MATLPLSMFDATMGGDYPISSTTALLQLMPSIALMLVVARLLKADLLAMVRRSRWRVTGPVCDHNQLPLHERAAYCGPH